VSAGKREIPVGGTLENFVYLAYLDDSKSRRGWQVLTAVIVKDSFFSTCELLSSVVIQGLMPDDKIGEFEEFHASHLYLGEGVFKGIDQAIRFQAIERILGLLNMPLPVVYGAVHTKRLSQELYGSANPVDVGFRICATGISEWLTSKFVEELESHANSDGVAHLPIDNPHLGVMIVDNGDNKIKNALQDSFRTLRPRVRPPNHVRGQLSNIIDDMFFGDSRYSLGIQLADLCCYFIGHHLDGEVTSDGFYKMIEPHIVYSKRLPDEASGESVKSNVADPVSSPSTP
jgi:hypothetical protein